jgi:hypothetical protein
MRSPRKSKNRSTRKKSPKRRSPRPPRGGRGGLAVPARGGRKGGWYLYPGKKDLDEARAALGPGPHDDIQVYNEANRLSGPQSKRLSAKKDTYSAASNAYQAAAAIGSRALESAQNVGQAIASIPGYVAEQYSDFNTLNGIAAFCESPEAAIAKFSPLGTKLTRIQKQYYRVFLDAVDKIDACDYRKEAIQNLRQNFFNDLPTTRSTGTNPELFVPPENRRSTREDEQLAALAALNNLPGRGAGIGGPLPGAGLGLGPLPGAGTGLAPAPLLPAGLNFREQGENEDPGHYLDELDAYVNQLNPAALRQAEEAADQDYLNEAAAFANGEVPGERIYEGQQRGVRGGRRKKMKSPIRRR